MKTMPSTRRFSLSTETLLHLEVSAVPVDAKTARCPSYGKKC